MPSLEGSLSLPWLAKCIRAHSFAGTSHSVRARTRLPIVVPSVFAVVSGLCGRRKAHSGGRVTAAVHV